MLIAKKVCDFVGKVKILCSRLGEGRKKLIYNTTDKMLRARSFAPKMLHRGIKIMQIPQG